jgi:hypothetical protein
MPVSLHHLNLWTHAFHCEALIEERVRGESG